MAAFAEKGSRGGGECVCGRGACLTSRKETLQNKREQFGSGQELRLEQSAHPAVKLGDVLLPSPGVSPVGGMGSGMLDAVWAAQDHPEKLLTG